MIKDVVTAQSKSDGGKERVTDEDIMKSKPYQDLLKTKKDELATQKTEFENQINTLKSEQMAEKNFAFVGKTAIEKLAGLNPVISQNAEIASNIQNLFIKSITDKYDIVEKDGENITEESITSSILDKDKERVKVLTNSKKEEHFQDGYKKAKKEERAKLEEEVKAEFGIESDKTGIDLIKDVVTAQSKSEGGKAGVTDEDIMKSKPYQDLLKTKKDELAIQKTEFENQINTLKSEQMAEKNFAFVGKTIS